MPESEVLAVTLPPTARSATDGRRFIVRALTDWDCEPLIDAAALLASEVITNAVIHARTPLTVTIQRRAHGRILVEVSDGSPLIPRRRTPTADATTGRGVGLLEVLALEWSVRASPTGKTVSFTLDPSSDPWEPAAHVDWLSGDL